MSHKKIILFIIAFIAVLVFTSNYPVKSMSDFFSLLAKVDDDDTDDSNCTDWYDACMHGEDVCNCKNVDIKYCKSKWSKDYNYCRFRNRNSYSVSISFNVGNEGHKVFLGPNSVSEAVSLSKGNVNTVHCLY